MTRRRKSGSPPYEPPVDRLLTLGEQAARDREWPDYRALGLNAEHTPGLIHVVLDPKLYRTAGDRPEAYAPIHAWRALGQLGAATAAEPLTRLFHECQESDWVSEEVPGVLGMIGPAALPVLEQYLRNQTRTYGGRVRAGESLVKEPAPRRENRTQAKRNLAKQSRKQNRRK